MPDTLPPENDSTMPPPMIHGTTTMDRQRGAPRDRGLTHYEAVARFGEVKVTKLHIRVVEQLRASKLGELGVPIDVVANLIIEHLSPKERGQLARGETPSRFAEIAESVAKSVSAKESDAARQAADEKKESKTKLRGDKFLHGRRADLGPLKESHQAVDAHINRSRDEAIAYLESLGRDPACAWIRHNEALLNLGRSAVEAIATAHLKEEHFKKMEKAGFTAKDFGDFAKWANREKIDAPKLVDAYAKTNDDLTTQERAQHRNAFRALFSGTKEGKDQYARQMLTFEDAHKNDPKARQHFEDEARRAHVDLDQYRKQAAVTKAKNAAAEKKDANVGDLADAFDAATPDIPKAAPPATVIKTPGDVKPQQAASAPSAKSKDVEPNRPLQIKTAAASPQKPSALTT